MLRCAEEHSTRCIRKAVAVSARQSRWRFASTSTKSGTSTIATKLSSRWLSDVKERLGKCITFGLSAEQKQEVGRILHTISQDWRSLVAGSEGFLTSRERCGMFRYPIAWGEQDPMAHVNNIVYNRWAETGRIAWTRNFAVLYPEMATYWLGLMSPKGEGLILRKITTEYKFPLKFPDRISVFHRLSTKPNGSDALLLSCVILSEKHQRIAARTTEDIAIYDYDRASKVNKQPWLVECLQNTWDLQEESKRLNSDRVSALLGQVRQLELASWDRTDAVEDVGSAID